MDTDHFRIPRAAGQSLFKDRGSKFYGHSLPARDSTEALQQLEKVKQQYHDARHHCFAFRCRPEDPEIRINDDGEPAHSAGDPIFNQIRSLEVWNIIVVVVRYFGGTKLGVSGLINAYKTAAQEALEQGGFRDHYHYEELILRFPYSEMGPATEMIRQSPAEIIDEEMGDNAGYRLRVRKSKSFDTFSIFEQRKEFTITKC